MKFEVTHLPPEAIKESIELLKEVLVEYKHEPTQEELTEIVTILKATGYTESRLAVAFIKAFVPNANGETKPLLKELVILIREYLFLLSSGGQLCIGLEPWLLAVFVKETKDGQNVLTHELQHLVDFSVAKVLPDLGIPQEIAQIKEGDYAELLGDSIIVLSLLSVGAVYFNRDMKYPILGIMIMAEIFSMYAAVIYLKSKHTYKHNELEQRARQAASTKTSSPIKDEDE